MSPPFEKLKQQTVTRADRITKFQVNSSKTAKDKRTEPFIRARLQLLEGYWAQFVEAHDELMELSTAEQRVAEDIFKGDLFSSVEQAFSETMSWLKEQLPVHEASDAFFLSSTAATVPPSTVRLPKINLPAFDGSYIDWPAFRDSYTSLIHENNSLSDVQKLHYLKSTLSGDAAKLLRHLTVTSTNYTSAWSILVNRYGNTRVLVTSNLQALATLKGMSTESADELRRVLDSFTQSVRSLENLKRPVAEWDDWLVYFLENKLDASTRRDWETTRVSSTVVPTFNELTHFLEGRIHTLSAIKSNNAWERKQVPVTRTVKSVSRNLHITSNTRCDCDKGGHSLMFCPNFRSRSSAERQAFVQDRKLCTNCLRADHSVAACPSKFRCRECEQQHHTMLHKPQSNNHLPHASVPRHNTVQYLKQSQPSSSTAAHFSNQERVKSTVLLATAMVIVQSNEARTVQARALLDQGSESSFITSSLANMLKLSKRRVNVSVLGIGACQAGLSQAAVSCEIVSRFTPNARWAVHPLVLPTLTHLIPAHNITKQHWPHITGLELADPEFGKSGRIDLILGAEIYAQILQNDLRQGPQGSPIAQATSLGWVLFGAIVAPTPASHIRGCLHAATSEFYDLNRSLSRFWEIEELPQTSLLTPDEAECEEFFKRTHYRSKSGRYVVKLPVTNQVSSLGESYQTASTALRRLERRLERDRSLQSSYSEFLTEYLQLGHMEPVSERAGVPKRCYYLPHHAVIKPSSTTTKLRVVFNASQRTDTGLSLNDVLYTGPKLQTDVFSIILKWRQYQYVFSADIEKMYRQILVDTEDRDLQRILWRNSPDKTTQSFRLLTVTYGTACAPYLACRILQQLADDYDETYPAAAAILRNNFYVDDALFGAYDKQTVLQLRQELCLLLQQAGFKLRKWMSNSGDLLETSLTRIKK